MSSEPSLHHIWSHFQNEGAAYGFHGSHLRHARVLREIQRLNRSTRPAVLNVGIGDGNLEVQTKSLGWDISSLDPDADAVGRLCAKGIEAKAGLIEKIPYADGQFDFVVASEVLEHLTPQARDAGLREIRRTLKTGGFLVGTVPCEEDLELNITACPNCRHVFHRWGHTTSFDAVTLRAELSRYFRVVSCRRTAFVGFRHRSLAGKLKSLLRLTLAKCGAAIAVPNLLFAAQK